MYKVFKKEVASKFHTQTGNRPELLKEEDLGTLPGCVKNYIIKSGSVGREKIRNFRAVFKGGIKFKPEDKWMDFSSEQYNFLDNQTRIFFIKSRKMGIGAKGFHLYKEEKARMVIKLAGIFKVADAVGPEMDQAETVTVFNDMCILAPASLIDKNIQWELIDNLTVNAIFSNGDIKVSAKLIFNETGQLVNFISNDRYATEGKTYINNPWSTPVSEYKDINGFKLASKGSAIHHRPDGDFEYIKMEVSDVIYNCQKML